MSAPCSTVWSKVAEEAAPVLRRWVAKGWIVFTAADLSGEEFQRKKRNAAQRACMARWRARRRAERAKAGLPKPGGYVLAAEAGEPVSR